MDGWRLRRVRTSDEQWASDLAMRDDGIDESSHAKKGTHDADMAYLQALRRIPRLGAAEEAELTAAREAGVAAAHPARARWSSGITP